MQDKKNEEKWLLQVLDHLRFSEQYYTYYEQCRGRAKMERYGAEEETAAISQAGVAFTYQRKEKFYRHQTLINNQATYLHIAFEASKVECIFALETPSGTVGGPYSLLALGVARLHDPNFMFSPPYPKLPFSNAQEMQQAIAFCVALYAKIVEHLATSRM